MKFNVPHLDEYHNRRAVKYIRIKWNGNKTSVKAFIQCIQLRNIIQVSKQQYMEILLLAQSLKVPLKNISPFLKVVNLN